VDIRVQVVNAFTDNGVGGNPAGVVLDADELNSQQKLSVASKIGLSETSFVSSSNSAAYKLEFFTPTRQIAHCGHATIATFNYLRQLNRIKEGATSKETIDGNRDIFIDGNMAFMEQLSPNYRDIEDRIDIVLESLGITDNELMANTKPLVVNTGNSFIIVPMQNEEAVSQIHPDFEAIDRISEGYDLIEQGHLMNPASPSLITVKLNFDNQKICKLMAGGEANVMKTMTISI
jgi:PhzF family phenazine biosynthesis protein